MIRPLRALRSIFDKDDIPSVILILGIILAGVGASRFHDGAGSLIVGALLILCARPLLWWIK